MKNRPKKDTTSRLPTSSMDLAIYRAVGESGQIRVSK